MTKTKAITSLWDAQTRRLLQQDKLHVIKIHHRLILEMERQHLPLFLKVKFAHVVDFVPMMSFAPFDRIGGIGRDRNGQRPGDVHDVASEGGMSPEF